MSRRRPFSKWASIPVELRPDDRLLLDAALAEGDHALRSWHALRTRFDIDRETGDAHRLVPLLGWNLERAGLDAETEPQLPRMLGLARRTWAQTQRRSRALSKVMAALQEHGIDSLVAKGAALAAIAYPSPSVRPMDDVDLLVHPDDLAEVFRLLVAWGFTLPDRSTRPPANELGAVGEDGLEIDVHWHLSPYVALPAGNDPDRALWSRAGSFTLCDGSPARTLSPGDQLFVALAHAMTSPTSAPLRWIADACWLVRSAPELAWDEVVEQAKGRGVTLAVGRALALLDDEGYVPVPRDVIRSLEEERAQLTERFLLYAARAPFVPNLASDPLLIRRVEAPDERRTYGRRLMLALDADSVGDAAMMFSRKGVAYARRLRSS